MQIKPFYIDKYPVTNAQFKKFLDATHYHPKDDLNFLKDWKNGTYPGGLGQEAGHVGIAGGCARVREVGRQATSRTSGSGNTPRKATMAALSRGAIATGLSRSSSAALTPALAASPADASRRFRTRGASCCRQRCRCASAKAPAHSA